MAVQDIPVDHPFHPHFKGVVNGIFVQQWIFGIFNGLVAICAPYNIAGKLFIWFLILIMCFNLVQNHSNVK